MTKLGTCILALIAMFLLASAAFGQVTTATVYGLVQDPTGGVVPGAKVTAINEFTQASRSAVTDGRGGFTLTFLPVGRYRISIEQAGFKTISRAGAGVSRRPESQPGFPVGAGRGGRHC